MLKALMQVQKVQQSSISSKWESLLNNLGHTARKLGKLEDALKYHQQALVLKPKLVMGRVPKTRVPGGSG